MTIPLWYESRENKSLSFRVDQKMPLLQLGASCCALLSLIHMGFHFVVGFYCEGTRVIASISAKSIPCNSLSLVFLGPNTHCGMNAAQWWLKAHAQGEWWLSRIPSSRRQCVCREVILHSIYSCWILTPSLGCKIIFFSSPTFYTPPPSSAFEKQLTN